MTSNSYQLVPPVEYYPFFVAVLYYFNERHLIRQCTGSIIKPHIVLTSSHCLQHNVGYIEYDLTSKHIELAKISERKLKAVKTMIAPKKNGKKPKFFEEVATIGLLVIDPFLEDDDMEVFGSISSTQMTHIGDTFTFAALKHRDVPPAFSGVHIPDPEVFTGMGKVVMCPTMNAKYGCIKVEEHEMPAGSGGPVMIGDEIVGVINQYFKYGTMELRDTFTFIRVDRYRTFIEEESKAAKPELTSYS